MPHRQPVSPIEGFALSTLVTVVLMGAASARANVDYEDQDVGPLARRTVLSFEGSLFIENFGTSEIADGVACAPSCPANGTKYQKSDESGVGGAISVDGSLDGLSCGTGCNPFDLLTIDVAEPTQSSGPVTIILTPFQADGPVRDNFSFTTDGVADGPGGAPDFETVTLPEIFCDVDSVVIISATFGVGFAIDDLVTEAPIVPAVGAWGQLALAAAIGGVVWRFSRARAAGSA